MKEVTVVIPNYNGMKYLPECMASLCQGQENAPEYEVLIIDNGSAAVAYTRSSPGNPLPSYKYLLRLPLCFPYPGANYPSAYQTLYFSLRRFSLDTY